MDHELFVTLTPDSWLTDPWPNSSLTLVLPSSSVKYLVFFPMFAGLSLRGTKAYQLPDAHGSPLFRLS